MNIKLPYFFVSIVGVFFLGFFVSDSLNSTKIVQNEKQQIKKPKTITNSNIEKNKTEQKQYRFSTIQKQSTQNTPKQISNNKPQTIQHLQDRQKENFYQAKKTYQQQQKRVAIQQKIAQQKQRYHTIQKILQSKNIKDIQRDGKMMQDKYVRNYISRIQFIEQQKILQQQMKLRQKIMKE
jgi:galactokinase